MEIVDVNGLRVACVTTDDAVQANWDAPPSDVDVVRVRDPQPEDWPVLRKAGFVVKPNWITWGARLRDDEDQFLGRLSSNERRKIRYGQRFAADNGVCFVLDTPLQPSLLEDFLTIYEQQILGMRNGVPYARQRQDQILARRESFFAVYAYQHDALIGGCLCLMAPDTSTVRLGFAAVLPVARQGMLVRALYMWACAKARLMSYQWMSLGTDPSLYGHIAKPGLFTFKSRLGFVPIPLQALDPEDDGADEADRVVRLENLTDPSLVVHYSHDTASGRPVSWADPAELSLDVLSHRADVDTRPYGVSFLDAIRVRTIEPSP